MNLVERFFRDLTGDLTVDCIRDGSFAIIQNLAKSIKAYLAQRDLESKRYGA